MPSEALGVFLQFPVQIGRDIFQSNGSHFETVTVPFRDSHRDGQKPTAFR